MVRGEHGVLDRKQVYEGVSQLPKTARCSGITAILVPLQSVGKFTMMVVWDKGTPHAIPILVLAVRQRHTCAIIYDE